MRTLILITQKKDSDDVIIQTLQKITGVIHVAATDDACNSPDKLLAEVLNRINLHQSRDPEQPGMNPQNVVVVYEGGINTQPHLTNLPCDNVNITGLKTHVSDAIGAGFYATPQKKEMIYRLVVGGIMGLLELE